MKKIIKDYFTFSKKERTAITILLLLIAFFIAMPYFYSPVHNPPVLNKALVDYLRTNKNELSDSDEEKTNSSYTPAENYRVVKKENFAFDPNTLSSKDWKRLGIGEKTIHTILNYRAKGGQFRSAEDIRKIWGFKKEDADRLIPYVRIPEKEKARSFKNQPSNPPPVTRKIITEIDINTATAEEWKSLPGIGEVLANRIIKFRERVGGFRAIEQVHKTYGITDSVFRLITPYLKLNTISILTINLNTVSAYELRAKANLPDAVAKAIIVYRQQYGPYQSVNELKKIVLISDSLFQRLSPMLTTQ